MAWQSVYVFRNYFGRLFIVIYFVWGTLLFNVKCMKAFVLGLGLMNKKRIKAHSNVKYTFSVITCECNHRILLLPDLLAMNRAIEYHVLEHGRKTNGVVAAKAEANHIRDILVSQLLRKIAYQKI